METLVVNLLGGSGCGKSTMASDIFSKLKKKGIECELVTEFAKDLVWEERNNTFKDQAYIFGKQYHRMFRLLDKVDVIITDSPLLLSIIYDKEQSDKFSDYVLYKFNQMNNLNFMLERVVSFNPNGRNESNIEEAKEYDDTIKNLMLDNGILYYTIKGNESGSDIVVNKVLEILNK